MINLVMWWLHADAPITSIKMTEKFFTLTVNKLVDLGIKA
jgi:hypothetical protein